MKIGSAHDARVAGSGQVLKVPKKKESLSNRPAQTDAVIISDEARAQLARLADETRAGSPVDPVRLDEDGIRIDRVKLAMERLASGYYSRPEIREEIAGRLADEMLGQTPESDETTE